MSEQAHIRLSELTGEISKVIENSLSNHLFWVVADVTNHSFKEKSNCHYFDLVEKDADGHAILAKIAGKAWGTGSSRIREFEESTGQKFTNNIHVLVQVKVTYHQVFGLALDIQQIDQSFTLGVIEQQRRATLASLVANNPGVIDMVGDRYVTRNSKLPLPAVIQHIAVVSSKTSAGNEDFKHTLRNNPYGYKFQIHDYFTVVQNEANVDQFIQALIEVHKSGLQYDVVVINRGGGAQTDFLIFDKYKVGLAVARFPIPIITGIGHQKNETIADLMAHTATKTPTKAAEFIIAHNKLYEDSILELQKRVVIKGQQMLSLRFQHLARLNSAIVNNTRNYIMDYKDQLFQLNGLLINKTKSILFERKNNIAAMSAQLLAKPRIVIYTKLNDLSNQSTNISVNSRKFLKLQSGYLGHFVSVMKLMSPDAILRKGFAYLKKSNTIISDPGKISTGDDLTIVLHDSEIQTRVISKKPYHGHDFDL